MILISFKMVYELFLEGNSIIIIEHDLDVLNFCDHIIEMGPTGGESGGYIMAERSPDDIRFNSNLLQLYYSCGKNVLIKFIVW